MTFKKLLVAASAAALIPATAAHALDVQVLNPTTVVTPALELEFPQNNANQTPLTFQLFTETGNFPAGNNIRVIINLPAGTSFAQNASGANVIVPANANAGTQAGAVAQSGQASAILQNGGGINATSAEFLISVTQNAQISTLQFNNLPIKLDGCVTAASPLRVTAQTEGGSNIEEGFATATNAQGVVIGGVAPCQSAVDVVFVDDEGDLNGAIPGTGNGEDDNVITLSSSFTALEDDVLGFNISNINGAVARDIAGNPVEAADVASTSFSVVFEDPGARSYIRFVNLNLDNGNQITGSPSTTPGVFNFALTNAANIQSFFNGANGNEDSITVVQLNPNTDILPVNTPTQSIPTQQVTVQNLRTTFSDARANFIPFETYSNQNLDFLQREGRTFGAFDWNSLNRTNSVYRVTGLSTTSDTVYSVTLSRANPPSANGTYVGTTSGTAATGGEFVMFSSQKFGAMGVPDFERADVTFNFETTAPVDVDRLQIRNDILSAFNDGANLDLDQNPGSPTGDFDNVGDPNFGIGAGETE